MTSWTSPSASARGLPISRVTIAASAVLFSSTSRERLAIASPRTGAGTFAHAGCAARAARAAATSVSASPSRTRATTSSRFAGLRASRSPPAGAGDGRAVDDRRDLRDCARHVSSSVFGRSARRVRYQRGEVVGGGRSAASSSRSSRLARSGGRRQRRARASSSVDPLGGDAERLGERGEVRRAEVDAERLVARALLVEAEHPVAAVVDQQDRQRDPLLGDRRELTAAHQEAAVPADAQRRPVVGERGADRRGEPEAERAPAERVGQAPRHGGSVEAADPVAGDAHVGDDRRVVRQPVAQRGEQRERTRLVALRCPT